MATKKTELRNYFVRLAKLDEERKAILKEMKSQPAYVIDYIREGFKQKANKWFVRTDAKGKPISLTEADKVIQFTEIIINSQAVNAGGRQTRAIKKQNSTIYRVRIVAQNLTGATYNIDSSVSVDRPIVPQLYQSMVELSDTQLKKLQKDLQKLEEQKIKNDRIKRLEEDIKKMQSELIKLKGK